jgi:dTDP-4-dehydrorhamnose reductase
MELAISPPLMERPGRMAAITRRMAHALVHMSAMDWHWTQTAAPNARGKALGEARVLDAFPSATILRPSIVLGEATGFEYVRRMIEMLPAPRSSVRMPNCNWFSSMMWLMRSLSF